jgi:hypothetical protein
VGVQEQAEKPKNGKIKWRFNRLKYSDSHKRPWKTTSTYRGRGKDQQYSQGDPRTGGREAVTRTFHRVSRNEWLDIVEGSATLNMKKVRQNDTLAPARTLSGGTSRYRHHIHRPWRAEMAVTHIVHSGEMS